MSDVNVDDVLNTLGFGRMQLIIFLGCSLQQLYVTNEQFGLALVTVASRCEFEIDEHRMAWLMSAVFTAQVLSSHYMGFQSDEIGRRKLLLISSMLSMFFSIISALMPEFWSFLAMRFIVGCVITGPGLAVLTYMSEFTKISLRAKVTNFISYSIGVSMIYVPATAMLWILFDIHVPIWGSYGLRSWRMLMMTNVLPGLIGWIIIYYMPESPKYYLSVDKPQKALEVLEKCCRYNKGKDVTLKSLNIESVSQPRLRSDSMPANKNCFYHIWYETKPLLRGVYLRQMLLSVSILFILFGESFGLMVWMPRVLKTIEHVNEMVILCHAVKMAGGLNSTHTSDECDLDNHNLQSAIFNGGCCLACFVLVSLLLLCLNRKTILLAFTALATLAGLLLNFLIAHALIVAAYVLLTVPSLCCLRLALSVIVDVIPTHLRSKAVALSLMSGRIGVLVVNIFVGYTLNWNCFFTYNTFVVVLIICLVLLSLLPKKVVSN